MLSNYRDMEFQERSPDEELILSGRKIAFRDLARCMIEEAVDAGYPPVDLPDLKRSVTVAEGEEVAVFRVEANYFLWDQEIQRLVELPRWPLIKSDGHSKGPITLVPELVGVWKPVSSPSLPDRVLERMARMSFSTDGSGTYHRQSGDREMTWVVSESKGKRRLKVDSHRGPMVYVIVEIGSSRMVLRGPNSNTEVVFERTHE